MNVNNYICECVVGTTVSGKYVKYVARDKKRKRFLHLNVLDLYIIMII